MLIRTLRRRISPRTVRRCRAIKQFFKKTLGSLSQTDYKTTSSIIVSVSDLKSKIDVIEQQLDKVSQHCRNISCLEHNLCRTGTSSTQTNEQNIPNVQTRDENKVETEVIFKTPDAKYLKSDESQSQSKYKWDNHKKSMNINQNAGKRRNSEYEDLICKHDTHLKSGDRSPIKLPNKKYHDKVKRVSSSVSLQSPRHHYTDNGPICSGYHRIKNCTKDSFEKDHRHRGKHEFLDTIPTERHTTSKKKHHTSRLDEDFIADIIKKQYKPVKLFGRRISDFSQFSAPVCRDQEYNFRDNIEEGIELCSCCFEGHRKHARHQQKRDISDMRSLCDTRLYTSKKQKRYKQAYVNNYNDSTYYDLVPVKEKSSPKSRRKLKIEDNKEYICCKEVLPSPRSHKPRLNLKAQHYEYDESILPEHNLPDKSVRSKRHCYVEEFSEDGSEIPICDVKHKQRHNSEKRERMKTENCGTSLQYSANNQENINNESLNTRLTETTADKTDKALSEIKDILQCFLQEIKKESIQGHKSDVSNKSVKQSEPQMNDQGNPNKFPLNASSGVNNYGSVGQCQAPPFMSPFSNPCCYPLLPICPINYGPNGYIIPSPSHTCATCANNKEEGNCKNSAKANEYNNSTRDETQDLIKEIYKCVAKTYSSPRNKLLNSSVEKKLLTSRSVGSSNASKHDAMVETPQMKCYSKSCEAIGSRMTSETYYSTNPTYSDTVIEKLSLAPSSTCSETEIDKKSDKHKKRFAKVIRKFRLFNRKKKDIIEEVSESESTVEADVKLKTKPPFKQDILNYNVHGTEYYHPQEMRCCRVHDSPRHDYMSRRKTCEMCVHMHPQDHSTPQHCPRHYAPPPACCSHDSNAPHHALPQVPLCLKEIEVKSIGTQSDRKISIFPRFMKKAQPTRIQDNTITTQTPKDTNILFNWEKLKEKAKQNANSSDPLKFSMKTQKQLAMGDMKMRNAMLKKMFYKRNPFSPRNLIVRTLLGKDISSFGDPPKMYKPRMFI